MKTRYLPAIITLTAGFITCMFGIFGQWGLYELTKRLLIVLLCFYVLGGVVTYILQKNFVEMKETEVEQEEENTEHEEQEQNINTEEEN